MGKRSARQTSSPARHGADPEGARMPAVTSTLQVMCGGQTGSRSLNPRPISHRAPTQPPESGAPRFLWSDTGPGVAVWVRLPPQSPLGCFLGCRWSLDLTGALFTWPRCWTLLLPSAAAPDVNGKGPTSGHFLGDTKGRSGVVKAAYPHSLLGQRKHISCRSSRRTRYLFFCLVALREESQPFSPPRALASPHFILTAWQLSAFH